MKNIFAIFFAMGFTACSAGGQTLHADNKPPRTTSYREIPAGPAVYGIFEGRPPCQEIARQMDSSLGPECTKVKWRLILFQDSSTKQPTSYQLLGRLLPSSGSWKIVKGIFTDADAGVLQLSTGRPGRYFYLLKGDDNVFFILDEHKNPRVGDDYLSYTLNRVELVPQSALQRGGQ